jgi:glycosyltransferase involved in cell wall biosynthesis
MNHPLGISFIIPCYNEQKNIASCILAIQKELNKYPELKSEIIVIDNNCTDDTAMVAHALGATVIVETKKGVVWARQAGSSYAKYAWLANIDADNVIPEGWLDKALDIINTKDYVAFSGPVVYQGAPLWVRAGTKAFYLLALATHYTLGPTLQGGNYLIRKDVLHKMDGYDTSFEFYGEDTRTASLAKQFGKVGICPKLWTWSSPRRLEGQGVLKTCWIYTLNYLSVSLLDRKATKEYKDYR